MFVLPSLVCTYRQKLLGHRNKGILGPGGEPVDGTAVDEARELTKAISEGTANRTKGQYYMQVLAYARQEECVQVILVHVLRGFPIYGARKGPSRLANRHFLVVGENVGHLKREKKWMEEVSK